MSVSLKHYFGTAAVGFALVSGQRIYRQHTYSTTDAVVIASVCVVWPLTGALGLATMGYELATGNKVTYDVKTKMIITKKD